MCGICGVHEFGEPTGTITERMLETMRDTMEHRGPDDAGWLLLQPNSPTSYATDTGASSASSDFTPTVGFAHRRLSIIDLSALGHQPMCNEDGTVWITYNGEVYNHAELRADLETQGHRYRSQSDTETIVHLYEEKGEAFVEELDGMFAFALYDAPRQKLILARDRVGIKPLYYCVQDGRILFASEIKAILAAPNVSRELDETSLHHYLTFLSAPAPDTLFKGIHKLKAGHYLTIDKDGNVVEHQYWDAAGYGQQEFRESTRGMTQKALEEYCVTNVRDLLRRSIEKRMMSDVPFGVFLSGGVDSSLNVALMSEVSSKPIETFSVAQKNSGDANEFEFARQVAKKFGTNHHEIEIDNVDFLDFIGEMAFYQDEPLADPVCVPLYYVSKLAHDNGITVVQIGEGADELFCGYGFHVNMATYRKKQWDAYRMLPSFVRHGIRHASRPFASAKLHDLLDRAARDRELFWSGAVHFGEPEKQQLLSHPLEGVDSHDCVKGHLDRFDAKRPDAEFIDRITYLEFQHRLPELLLMRVDKIGMANSIEARVPFLDKDLVEFGLNISRDIKIKDGIGKSVLKSAARGIIPDAIIDRPKMGFGGGGKTMVTDRILDFARDLYFGKGNGNHDYREYFNLSTLDRLFTHQYADQVDNSDKIWGLMNFALWYQKWL